MATIDFIDAYQVIPKRPQMRIHQKEKTLWFCCLFIPEIFSECFLDVGPCARRQKVAVSRQLGCVTEGGSVPPLTYPLLRTSLPLHLSSLETLWTLLRCDLWSLPSPSFLPHKDRLAGSCLRWEACRNSAEKSDNLQGSGGAKTRVQSPCSHLHWAQRLP